MSKDEKIPNCEICDNVRSAFCQGFAYGCKYGYEGILADGPIPDSEISSTWIMAHMLYDKLYKEE